MRSFDEADRLIRRGLVIRRDELGDPRPRSCLTWPMSLGTISPGSASVQGGSTSWRIRSTRSLLSLYQLPRGPCVGGSGSIKHSTGSGLSGGHRGDPEAGVALVREALEIQQAPPGTQAPEEVQASLK